ncbi:hypothetical protein CDD81_5965 [Ophiocordyceps australis]|uniref:RRM domain-containing protein n=1 Tax=Ophiocordyceps australis TaxID=1399860 RepID=A0A2C5YGV3_9HYPO|nr:hypothetical protein CDD81_5965 [Ophiocordyceps australis]
MQADSPDQSDALAQGRRIYLGNLLYRIKPQHVEQVLVEKGFGDFEKIHISIDPVSARNPGYCFVDFADPSTAQRALSSLHATIEGRPIRVGPCEPKKPRSQNGGRFAFQRWGDWGAGAGDNDMPSRGAQQGPHGALEHFVDMAQGQRGRRLYVGGLGKMIDQAQNNQEISDIFADFNPTAIGKRITPMPGHQHYCFVDFETKEEAQAAIQALNGKPIQGGGRLKVRLANNFPARLDRLPADEHTSRTHQTASWRSKDLRLTNPAEANSRAMASNDWRRKGAH